MKILITGTRGFVGSKLQKHLSLFHDVIGIRGREDFDQIETTIKEFQPEILIHGGFSVSYKPKEKHIQSDSVSSTARVSEVSKKYKIPHVVFLSAAGALGVSEAQGIRNEDDFATCDRAYQDFQETQYISDKITSERFFDNHPSVITVLYLTTIFGPGMNHEIVKAYKSPIFPVRVCPPGGTSYLGLSDFLNAMDLILAQRPNGRFVLSSGNITYAQAMKVADHIQRPWLPSLTFKIPHWTQKVLTLLSRKRNDAHLSLAVIHSAFGFKYYSPYRAMLTIGWKPKQSLNTLLREIFLHKNNFSEKAIN